MTSPIQTPNVGSRKRLTGLLAAAAVVIAATPSISTPRASASQNSNAVWSVAGNVATETAPNGLVTTLTMAGESRVVSATPLAVAPTASMFGAGINPATTSFLQIATGLVAGNTCASDGLCTNLGTMTITFSRPVTNPVLHFSGIGGGQRRAPNMWRWNSNFILTSSTPAGATLGAPSAGSVNLNVSGNRIFGAAGGNSQCSSTSDALGAADTTAGCGSIPIIGTVSTIVFQLDQDWKTMVSGGALPNTFESDALNIQITTDQDFADAPATYNGAQAPTHVVGDLALGATVDADNITVADATASPFPQTGLAINTAGDNAVGADEDGITVPPIFNNQPGASYALTVPISGASQNGEVCGFIDFDRNGSFEVATERACGPFAPGQTSVPLTWVVPAGTVSGVSVLRLRAAYGPTGGQAASPTGLADSGEVEDHTIGIHSDLCVAAGSPAPVFGLIYNAGGITTRWNYPARALEPSSGIAMLTAPVLTSALVNAQMIDPINNRMVVQINQGGVVFLAAYDERMGGWYRASNNVTYFDDVAGVQTNLNGNTPRGGFGPNGVGYMNFSGTSGWTWKITPNGTYMYDVVEIQRGAPIPSGAGNTSGDLAFDQSGQGWILAAAASGSPSGVVMQLSKFNPSETPGVLTTQVPWLRLTLNGADVPTNWNLTGFAFGGDGYGYVLGNSNVPNKGLYRFSLADGVMTRVSPNDATLVAGSSYDLASCTYPDLSGDLNVTKTIVTETGPRPGVLDAGETVTFQIHVSNPTAIARTVTGAAITETVPAGMTAAAGDDFTFTAGAAAGTTGTAAAQYTINAGSSHDYMFRAVVDLVLPAGMVSSTNTVAVDAVGCATAPNDCTETLWAPGSVSGTVFVDGTSQPIEGVSVSLLDSSGAVVATTITAADGTYSFANIAAGDYAIIETQPVGYGQGLVAPSGTLAVTVTAGTAAAGNDFSERLGTISGTVYIDGTNTPIAGVELTLLDGSDAVVATALTDSNGNYVFTDVLGGPFKIVETQPAGYGEGLVTSSDMIAGDLIPGDTSTGNDFSEAAATIAGRVFVDGTSAPLGNVTIELLDSTNTVIATTVTATDGTYMFADLIAGDYQVREIQPSVFGPGVVEADNLIPVTVAAGATSVGNDFSEGTAAITGRVFVDGTLAAISGVTVSLTDSSGTVVATTTTVADGSYSFAGLTLGDYTIVEAQPAGYLNGAVTPGNSIPVTVTAAGSYDNDFSESGATISGRVFVDSTMTPLAGVTIALIDSAGTVVSSTTTVADGSYEFAGVAAGDFTVTETQPAGYGAGLIVPGNSIAVPVAAGIGSAGNDFSESLASISGTVLVDGTLAPLGGITVTLTDSSGAVVATAVTAADGTYTFADVLAGDYTVTQSQPVGYGPGAVVPGNVIAVVVVAGVASTGNDFTEAFGMISGSVFVDGTLVPVEGVTITLAGTDASGATIELVTETDSAGNYTFTALLAGNYTIVETQPDGYMPGVTVPSNSIPVALTGGAASSVNDFSEALGTISGHVYVDGTHAPLPGVTVTLKDDTGAVVATTLTDAAGLYEFTGLTTGVYTITQTQPANWDPGAVTPNNTWTVTLDSPVSAGNDFSESSPPDVTVPSTTTPSQPTTTIGGGDLPSAGTDTASVVLVAALAAAVGVLLMLTRRRRRIL